MSRTIKLLISNWPRTREFSQLLQTGNLLLTFLTMVTRWSRSTSNFYVLIGQKLTGAFKRKIYAASWNLFTGSWNWRSFVYKRCEAFNCLFLLDAQNEIQMLARFLSYSWLVCLLVEKCAACQSHRKSDFGWMAFTHFPLPDAYYKEGSEKSQAILMAFRSILTGKPELLLYLMCFFFLVS